MPIPQNISTQTGIRRESAHFILIARTASRGIPSSIKDAMICINSPAVLHGLAGTEPVAYRQISKSLPRMARDAMISARNLSFERYFQPVFEPVTFDVAGGHLLRVIGANGSGKTTLIRLLAGILDPTGGSIRRSGNGMAHVGHLLAIKDDLSVTENLRFVRDFHGTNGADLENVIRQVGLRRVRDQLARTLSAGQRKRCALARLLITAADVWLLDEPYSNLDDEGFKLVDTMLEQHLRSGGACIMATHGSHRPPVRHQSDLRLVQGGSTRCAA